jgi:hypothetical protein
MDTLPYEPWTPPDLNFDPIEIEVGDVERPVQILYGMVCKIDDSFKGFISQHLPWL